MGGACSTNGREEKSIEDFGGKAGRDHYEDRRRWEDNIKMDLREIGWGGMDWIDLAQDRDQWRPL
jgi:hypothetical protein